MGEDTLRVRKLAILYLLSLRWYVAGLSKLTLSYRQNCKAVERRCGACCEAEFSSLGQSNLLALHGQSTAINQSCALYLRLLLHIRNLSKLVLPVIHRIVFRRSRFISGACRFYAQRLCIFTLRELIYA